MRSAFVVSGPRATALRALNYSPHVESFRRKVPGRSSVPLGDLVRTMGPAYGAVFTRIDCHPTHGVELLSQTDMFAAEPSGRVIRRDSMPVPENHEIKRWQVLIAGAGTLGETELYGRALIADSRLVGRYVGPDAMVLNLLEPGADLSLLTYAVLLTKAGIRAVRSTSYGTKILRLRSDMLRSLPIPVPEGPVQARVASLVRTSVLQRERYAAELKAARTPIEALPEMLEAAAMCSDRKARCISWQGPMPTLCAWNFASAGGALGFLQRRWPGRLGDVLGPLGTFNGPRFARVACQHPFGVPFVSQRDVFLVRPVPRRIVHPGFEKDLLMIPPSCLLVAGHGTVAEGEIFGRVRLPDAALRCCAMTQDILRVQTKEEYYETAYSFLSTQVGFRLLRSSAVGTKILTMRTDLLAAIPFPSLDVQSRQAVRGHVLEALRAKDAADAAEAEAMRIVEEEVLPQWLA